MSLTRAERETIVRLSEDQEEPMTVYTHREGLAKRLKRSKEATLVRVSKIDGEEVAWTFKCPRDWFKAPKAKRAVSEAKREEMRQRALARGFGGKRKRTVGLPEQGGAS